MRKSGVLSGCGPSDVSSVVIDTDKEDIKEIIAKILSIDYFVVDGECRHPDISLLAFLVRILGKEVYWVNKEPKGLLGKLSSGKLKE